MQYNSMKLNQHYLTKILTATVVALNEVQNTKGFLNALKMPILCRKYLESVYNVMLVSASRATCYKIY
jgi:hypothetical protein